MMGSRCWRAEGKAEVMQGSRGSHADPRAELVDALLPPLGVVRLLLRRELPLLADLLLVLDHEGRLGATLRSIASAATITPATQDCILVIIPMTPTKVDNCSEAIVYVPFGWIPGLLTWPFKNLAVFFKKK